MASAIDYLHNQLYMVHRDLHGANWMISEDFKVVKLVDFGTALVVGKGNQLAKTFNFIAFASPEIIDKTPSSYESDIWYLGMTFYWLANPKNQFPWTN